MPCKVQKELYQYALAKCSSSYRDHGQGRQIYTSYSTCTGALLQTLVTLTPFDPA